MSLPQFDVQGSLFESLGAIAPDLSKSTLFRAPLAQTRTLLLSWSQSCLSHTKLTVITEVLQPINPVDLTFVRPTCPPN
jgi:hypothetical protein